MNYTQKIEEVLTQALTEKTFSLEIIEKIKSLKDGFENSQKTLESTQESLKESNKSIAILNAKNSELESKVKWYEGRIEEIDKKEKELEKNKYELQFQKDRANEIKELFGIVFKNPVAQKSVFANVPISGSNGYINTGTETRTETESII